MTYSIVAISGSPSRNSTTAKLAEYALAHVLARSDSQGRHIHVIDLDPKALLRGDLFNSDTLASPITPVERTGMWRRLFGGRTQEAS